MQKNTSHTQNKRANNNFDLTAAALPETSRVETAFQEWKIGSQFTAEFVLFLHK